MSTLTKDFKVKNGLVVANGGTFGNAVVVGQPTANNHAATKEYVDGLVGGMQVSNTAPLSPNNGDLWFDTITQRINVAYSNSWSTVANVDDTLNLPDHIHDTSIEGNGLIVSYFISSGASSDPQGTGQDSGGPFTNSWTNTFDGGVATDNFN